MYFVKDDERDSEKYEYGNRERKKEKKWDGKIGISRFYIT